MILLNHLLNHMPPFLFFTVLKLPLDYLLVVAAALASYALRFHSLWLQDARPVQYVIPFGQYVQWSLLYGILMVGIFALLHLYSLHKQKKFFDELFTVVAGASWGILGGVFIMFFAREFIASRFILVALWVFCILFVMAGRILVRGLCLVWLRQGKGLVSAVLLGNSPHTELLANAFAHHPRYGYRVAARYIAWNSECERALASLHKEQGIGVLMVLDASLPRRDLLALLEFCDQRHITLTYSADMLGARAPKLIPDTIAGDVRGFSSFPPSS